MHRTIRIAATLATGALVVPLLAFGQAVPAAQHALMRGAPDNGRALPPRDAREHVIYGRIDAIRGSTLVLRTRAGKAQVVDASEAIRSGSYSEPLFIGKIVVVSGTYAATRTMRASSVMRMGSLDAGTPADR